MPPSTSAEVKKKVADALKVYLKSLDDGKRKVELAGVASDTLRDGDRRTELSQYAWEKKAFFFVPKGAGNVTDESGAATATVIVIGHTPEVVTEAHQWLLRYERASATVPMGGGYVTNFVQRKLAEYKEEAARRFEVELEIVSEGKEGSLVITGRSTGVAKAEKWLSATVKQIIFKKLAVGDCALRPEDMERAIRMARREALAEIRSQDMVDDAEEDSTSDDDTSTTSASVAAPSRRYVLNLFRPKQGPNSNSIICVAHRDHLQIAVDKVKELVLNVVRESSDRLSAEAVRAHSLETPAGRKAFQQQFNLHSVFYDVARRRVTLTGPASEVQSALEEVKQAENVAAYCLLADAALISFYRSKPFQEELRRAIGTQADVRVNTVHKDNKDIKKVVCLRGPKGAVEQLQPGVQGVLDALLRTVRDELWHISAAKFAFLKDEKEAVCGIAKANEVRVSFLDRADEPPVDSTPVRRTSNPDQPKHYPLRDGCVLEVVKVDLSSLRVACLVNPANEQLMHAGGIARVISEAGGPIIEYDSEAIVSRHGGRLKSSQVVSTSPGDLAQAGVRRLLHVVVPRASEADHVELLAGAIGECLRQCDEAAQAASSAQGGGGGAVSRLASMFGGALGSKPAPSPSEGVDSIAFTLMGSGIYGYDKPTNGGYRGKSAQVIIGAIKAYFDQAGSKGNLKRVVVFDSDQDKWETAIHQADTTFGSGMPGPLRQAVATPIVAPTPAPSTARPSLPPKPQPPAKPSQVFFWNNASGNARNDTGNCVWVAYDYDQCMAIFNAQRAGQQDVHVTGDLMGQPSDTKHVDPVTGRGEYVVYFNYKGTTDIVQRNAVSKWERLVSSKPVTTDADLPPLYDRALGKYQEALAAWKQQEQDVLKWEKQQKRRQQQQQQAQGGGGGGAAAPQEQRPIKTVQGTKAVQLIGFAAKVEGTKRALEQLLKDNTCVMEGEGILLPAFLSLDEVKEDIAQVLDEYEAEIVVAGDGVHGSSTLRVRAVGEIARVRVAHHLQAAISRAEKDMVPKHWEMREPTADKVLNLVTLETDEEYENAKARFLAHGFTCGGIISIERIENPELYRKYVTQRRLITSQLREAGIADGGKTEWLIHGTSTTSPSVICGGLNGLSPNFCDKGMYSKAAYLAEQTAYSANGYAHDLGNGLCQLMLVEMVVGRVEERPASDPSIRLPQAGYHTVRGPVAGGYHAYMKYEHYHAYATHIVTYRKAA